MGGLQPHRWDTFFWFVGPLTLLLLQFYEQPSPVNLTNKDGILVPFGSRYDANPVLVSPCSFLLTT